MRRFDLVQAQSDANAFVREYLSTKSLGLPELSERDFELVMDAIVRAMMDAWASGYMTAHGK